MTEPVDTVIKVGGSILRDEQGYRSVAEHLRPWIERGSWVVVSAARGVTDELERLSASPRVGPARRLIDRHSEWAGEPLAEELALELEALARAASPALGPLLSWGERASAACLSARLAALGFPVPVVELPRHGPPEGRSASIVPGFYLRDEDGRAILLPRGGSDISAVLLAARLGAREVRFWKDGGGVQDLEDPATIVSEIDSGELLERLGNSTRPLHPEALRLALEAGVELVLEEPVLRRPATRVRHRATGTSAALSTADSSDRPAGAAPEFPARWAP